QRYVDSLRSRRRFEALPEEDSPEVPQRRPADDQDRRRHAALVLRALRVAVGRLPARDRLRLGLYYAQQLTLANTGRILGEHTATVSRQLARSRQLIRDTVDGLLRDEAGLDADEIARCYAHAAEDSGAMDLDDILGSAVERKIPRADRSN